ncbi:MAG: 30S ribosomal protein S20 [Nitrospirales bacterium]|nr:30S ribosomal protein S20 [Nitrospirales bacterium]
MPVVHTSTIKRVRQAEKRRQRNRSILRGTKTLVKKVKAAVEEKNAELAQSLLRQANSTLQKAVTKGTLKRNAASRHISRLTLQVNRLKAA